MAEDKRLLGPSSEEKENHPSCLAVGLYLSCSWKKKKKPGGSTDGACAVLHLLHQSAECGSLSSSLFIDIHYAIVHRNKNKFVVFKQALICRNNQTWA